MAYSKRESEESAYLHRLEEAIDAIHETCRVLHHTYVTQGTTVTADIHSPQHKIAREKEKRGEIVIYFSLFFTTVLFV